ncbi:SurA N-terminal domain-containing protein [Pyrinomonas sp.]|uniref:SurA N-terminal domain-containing protein n=1 Tax=Pyrinomonas sp. TaxID=2080306 RepID=UPI00331E7D56
MHKKKAIFFICVAILSLGIACNRRTSGSAEGVAATVNGKEIMLSEVDRIISQQTGGQQAQLSPLELAAARLQVLDGLIQQEVLFQRAEKENLLPSEDEITQAISAEKLQRNLTEEEFQRMLRESGQTEQALRETVRKQLAIQKLQDKVIGKITISDREVEDFYNNNKQQFVNARGVGLANIVVDPQDNGYQDDAKNDAEAKLKIDEIYQRLKTGNADFATVARARSEDPSNVRGGDIGFATEEQLKQAGFPADLINKFFNSMQVGDITPPIRFPNGRWYIFKLTDKRLQTENLTLDSPGVRDQIKNALINQRRTLLNAALLEVAMNEAKIVNHLARNMLSSPNNLSGIRPAPAASPSPQATAQPTASPVVSPQASPQR